MAGGRPRKKTGDPKSKYNVSEKALAQRRKNVGVIPFKGEDVDYNAAHIAHILKIQEIASHVVPGDPVSMKAAFINYLVLCQQDGFKVGTLAACTAMGLRRHTILSDWERGKNQELRDLAIFVRSTCSLSREALIADQKINPVIGIFWQRNFDGLRNDTEQVQAVEQSEEEKSSTQEYIDRYGKLLEE